MKSVPSKKWFLLPTAVLLVGICLTAYFGTQIYRSVQQPALYIRTPGTSEVAVPEEGGYEIYYEYRLYQLDQEVAFLFESATGAVIQSQPSRLNSSYSMNGVNGQLVARITIPQPGPYRVTVTPDPGTKELQFRMGKNVVAGPVTSILGAVFSFVFPLVLAVIGYVLVAVLRHLATQKNRQMEQRSSGPPPRGTE